MSASSDAEDYFTSSLVVPPQRLGAGGGGGDVQHKQFKMKWIGALKLRCIENKLSLKDVTVVRDLTREGTTEDDQKHRLRFLAVASSHCQNVYYALSLSHSHSHSRDTNIHSSRLIQKHRFLHCSHAVRKNYRSAIVQHTSVLSPPPPLPPTSAS